MKLEGLFSLYPPLRIDSDFHVKAFEKFIDHFETERELHVRGSDFHDGELLFVRVEPCRASRHRRFFRNAPFCKPENWLLRFFGSFNFPGKERYFLTDHAGKKVRTTEKELRSLWASWLPDHLDLTVQTYIVSLMIAFSGAVRPTRNVWLLEGRKHKFANAYVSTIHESVEYMVENGLLPDADLNPNDAIRWAFSQSGIFDGYSNTPASRSLNYFTRLFTEQFRNDELGDLVWALAGIEALLVEGGRSSSGQLKEKLIAIFGSDTNRGWLREMTGKMYGYRSAMVHGDRQIKSAFRWDETEQIESRFREEYDSERFAIGILVLLLQQVVKRDIARFQFQTVSV